MSGGADASVLVVSEEKGIISIASNGRLVRNVDDTQLRQHLTRVMAKQETGSWFAFGHKKHQVVEASQVSNTEPDAEESAEESK
jgi:hypothetical protein